MGPESNFLFVSQKNCKMNMFSMFFILILLYRLVLTVNKELIDMFQNVSIFKLCFPAVQLQIGCKCIIQYLRKINANRFGNMVCPHI